MPKAMEGKLTQIGAQQHRGIADRMFANFSKVLERDDVNVSARSSIVGRCVASMQAFVDELHQLILN